MKKYYYTIGEVSNLLEVKQHVLRYWEKEFKQVQPRKKFGRNRRYTQEDIETLKKIKYMLYTQRFTIEGCKKKLQELAKTKNQIELDFSQDRSSKKKSIQNDLSQIKELLDTK